LKRLIALLLCLLLLSGCAPKTEYLLAQSVCDDRDGTPQRSTFEYDEAGRLIALTNEDDDFFGMGPLYERIEFEYDDHGQLLQERIYDETGCIRVREYVNSYDASGRLVYFDSYTDGELFESRTNSYDEQGNLTRTEFIHRSPYSTDTIVETFDEAGNVLRNETTVVLWSAAELNESERAPVITEYFYEDGLLIRSESDEGRRDAYTYDRKDRITRLERFQDEVLQCCWEYTYTANTETEIQYEPDGTMTAKQVRTYDKAGNLIKEEYFDSADRLCQTATHSYIPK